MHTWPTAQYCDYHRCRDVTITGTGSNIKISNHYVSAFVGAKVSDNSLPQTTF